MLTSFCHLPSMLCCFYLSFLLPLLVLPSTNSIYFEISQFDETNVNYQGDAVSSGGSIEFNMVNYINRVGWATYPERVRLWDSSSGKVSDFTSHFTFTIDTLGAPNYGHGLAFFLAPVGFEIPPNSAGGFLGLFNTTTMKPSQNQIVSVEFDSFPNPEWDPKVEHVGINNNSIASAVYTPWNASFHSEDTADAWITYNSTNRNLSVFWTYKTTSNPQENSSLFYIIDLSKFLPEWVTVGFSAATGQNVEQHRLLSWEFNSTLNVKDTNGKSSKRSRIIIGVSVSVLVLAAGAITASVILWRRKQIKTRKRSAETMTATSINEDLERGAGPRRFSYADLVSATNNFSGQRKLGEGGFGAVYRGYLNDMNMAVAVKKISKGSRQEIASGRKANDPIDKKSDMSLVEWIWDLYGCQNLSLAIDKRLDLTNFDDEIKQAERLMIVGLWCAHPGHNLRPSIRQAIHVLNFEAAIPNLPAKMPVPVFHAPLPSFSSSDPASITNTSLDAGR
ncbi:unnamed protein product [Dovyalis caffra]|uniref:Legume lectin domain-containing protein n=1 Tax=Dovyalis caffra TaxID=77055 RepID=A0AAV1RTY1_9ROSI|nr:unnamed protein product [Dovyalis caffra]